MKIKTKISVAMISLFGAILCVILLSIFYLKQLSGDAENILKDNYESLEYSKRIIEGCDSLAVDTTAALAVIEMNIRLQEENVTESGERELTDGLRRQFELSRASVFSNARVVELRRSCLAIQNLNMKAIVEKNEITARTSKNATTYLIIIGTIVALVAFTFVVNFPGYIANPISILSDSIKSIANKNYEERLHFDRKDEFGELAEAFNLMAEKLDEYEHSNLAKILFEKKRIETIINRMPDPVIGLDEDRKIVFANDQALSLLNMNHIEVVGRYAPDVAVENDLLRSLIKPSDPAQSGTALVKIAISGKENYFSKENIIITYKPTGERASLALGKVIILKNVTPYKELDLAKTNFIATISHELKTPIASLQMGVKLLHDSRVGSLNEEQSTIVRTLADETARLTKLTQELLDLAQVETGNIKLNLKKIDPTDIVQLAQEAVKFHAGRKKVSIEVQCDEQLPEIKADLDKTTWVLVNLLTNAIRYSPENETVILTCNRRGDAVRFSVADHGPGIEGKYLTRLFEKFFQVPGSPSGTGLGLAISKEFIEAQGGDIHVESEPGRGSIFSFELAA